MQRKNNPEKTREKILLVASELFLEKGYDKTSMQDIVNALGMSKGAVFHHFSSKDEIFEMVMTKLAIEQMNVLTNMLSNELQGYTAREKLIRLIDASLAESEDKVAKMLDSRIEDPKIVMHLMKFNMNYSAPLVARIMKEGAEDGTIHTAYPDECAQVFLLLVNTWCNPTIFECDIPTYRKRLEYMQFIMKALGADILSTELIEQDIKSTENLYEVNDDKN